MKKPAPVDREVQFEISELFFSITNKRGVIRTGNEVFYRVANYDRDVMIGAPHSIIRHPEMPRCVFKLLWDTIKQDKPIGAYVKNMASDGSYYWVYAVVVSIDGGYLSVRLKPSSDLFKTAMALYPAVLQEEAKTGMDGAAAFLMRTLNEAGFESYEHFMARALMEEVQGRDKIMAANVVKDVGHPGKGDVDLVEGMSRVLMYGGFAVKNFTEVFVVLDKFRAFDSMLRDTIAKIIGYFGKLQVLSINMALAATHIGKTAATLAVIAEGFQKNALEIQNQLASFETAIERVRKVISATEFQTGQARLQIDMTCDFVRELLLSAGDSTHDEAEFAEKVTNCKLLLEIALKSCEEAGQRMRDVLVTMRGFGKEALELEMSVTGLEIIRQTGKIETVQLGEGAHTVEPYIQEMEKFVASIRGPVRELTQTVEGLNDEIGGAITGLHKVTQHLDAATRIWLHITALTAPKGEEAAAAA